MKRFTAWSIIQVLIFTSYAGVCAAAFPGSYSLEQSGTGFAVVSTEQYLTFPNSIKMGTVTTSDRSAITFEGGPQLSDLTAFSYWTYTVAAGDADQLTAWTAIYLDANPGCTYDSWATAYSNNSSDPNLFYIQAEPYFATGYPVLDTWQQQDAFGATPLTWVGLESPDYPHEAPSLADYINGTATNFLTTSYGNQAFASREYGSLYVCAIKIRMGSGGPWANTLAYVDDVDLNGRLTKFEPADHALSVPTLPLWALGLLILAILTAEFWRRRTFLN